MIKIKRPPALIFFFTTQPNLVMESGVIHSPIKTCHHQIIFGKMKFDYFRPPPFKREVWHFEKAKIDLIQRSIKNYHWERSFCGLGVDQQVEVFSNILMNIFRNFIPHETITCKAKDPPWMNKEIKLSLRRKNRLYKKYISRGMTNADKAALERQNILCETLITDSKNRYILNLSKRLNDPLTSSKTYWSTLNHFIGRGKMPIIPPLEVNGELVTDFSKKHLYSSSFLRVNALYSIMIVHSQISPMLLIIAFLKSNCVIDAS